MIFLYTVTECEQIDLDRCSIKVIDTMTICVSERALKITFNIRVQLIVSWPQRTHYYLSIIWCPVALPIAFF